MLRKIIPYILILIALVGLLGPGGKASAQSADGKGTCTIVTNYVEVIQIDRGTIKRDPVQFTDTKPTTRSPCTIADPTVQAVCETHRKTSLDEVTCVSATWQSDAGGSPQDSNPTTSDKSAFETSINSGCTNLLSPLTNCLLKIFYYTYFQLPAFALWLSAQVFNALISLVIQSSMYTAPFIGAAWGVVRDLSNIFFILVLLYIAIKIILDLGGHEAKQMIAKVIVVALLINFSMFFTKVVIDSSNILALIFYNKLDTKTSVNGVSRPYTASTPGEERDVSGAMYKNFNATSLLTGSFLDELKTTEINGKTVKNETLPFALTFGIIVVSGSIMLWAAFTFFAAAIFFLGRLIDLWVLIIFSPFAFMSYPIPLLSGIEYIGWNAWSKKLLATSFMAPIFMFFMYLIFKLLETNIFSLFTKGKGAIVTILGILLPALIILALLHQATKLAKKGGGQFGEIAMAGAKIVGGLALGAATGGTALALTSTLGARAQRTANDDNLKKAASGDKEHFARMGVTDVNVQKKMQAAAQKKLATANKNANRSFDLRDTGIGKFAAKQSGIDFNKGMGIAGLDTKSLEGGYRKKVEKKTEEEQKKQKTYELSGSAADKQKERADQYEKNKLQAESDAKNTGQKFNEDAFKETYEKGILVGYGRDDRKVESGSVDKVEKINGDRKKAYATSLEDKRNKDEARSAMQAFWDEYKKGVREMVTTPGGIAATAAGTAVGGVGGVITVAGGGFLLALKETLAPSVRATDAEVIAGFRKGPDEYKELIKKLKKDLEGGHGSKEDKKPAHVADSAPKPDTPGTAQAHPEKH